MAASTVELHGDVFIVVHPPDATDEDVQRLAQEQYQQRRSTGKSALTPGLPLELRRGPDVTPEQTEERLKSVGMGLAELALFGLGGPAGAAAGTLAAKQVASPLLRKVLPIAGRVLGGATGAATGRKIGDPQATLGQVGLSAGLGALGEGAGIAARAGGEAATTARIGEKSTVPLSVGERTGSSGLQKAEEFLSHLPIGSQPLSSLARAQLRETTAGFDREFSQIAGLLPRTFKRGLEGAKLRDEMIGRLSAMSRLFGKPFRELRETAGQLPVDAAPLEHRLAAYSQRLVPQPSPTAFKGAQEAIGKAQQQQVQGLMLSVIQQNPNASPAVLQRMITQAQQGLPLTFELRDALDLRTWLGSIANPKKGVTVPTSFTRSQARDLWNVVTDMIVDAIPPTTAEGQKWQAAVKRWREFRKLTNVQLIDRIEKEGVSDAGLVTAIFGGRTAGGAIDVEPMLAFRQAAGPRTFFQAAQAKLADIYERSLETTRGLPLKVIDPKKFHAFIKPYLAEGVLEEMLGPQTAEKMRRFVSTIVLYPQAASRAGIVGQAQKVGIHGAAQVIALSSGMLFGHKVAGIAGAVGLPTAASALLAHPAKIGEQAARFGALWAGHAWLEAGQAP